MRPYHYSNRHMMQGFDRRLIDILCQRAQHEVHRQYIWGHHSDNSWQSYNVAYDSFCVDPSRHWRQHWNIVLIDSPWMKVIDSACDIQLTGDLPINTWIPSFFELNLFHSAHSSDLFHCLFIGQLLETWFSSFTSRSWAAFLAGFLNIELQKSLQICISKTSYKNSN